MTYAYSAADYDHWLDTGSGGPHDDSTDIRDNLPWWAKDQLDDLSHDNAIDMADDVMQQARRMAVAAVWWARSGATTTVDAYHADQSIAPAVPTTGSNADRIESVADDLYRQMVQQMPDMSADALARDVSIETDPEGEPYLTGACPWADMRIDYTWGAESSDGRDLIND